MRGLALINFISLIIFTSCAAGFKTHGHMVGERYALLVPEKVDFFTEPSIKGEPLLIERPEEFIIEGVECGERENDGACPYVLDEMLMPENVDELFYKVKFKTGKTGYLNARYIFYPGLGRYFLAKGPRYYIRNDNVFEIKTDYNVMWDVVVDSIDELGYVIAQMRKEDGYIVTQIRNTGDRRDKMSARLSKNGEYAAVTVNGNSEHLVKTKIEKESRSYWYSDTDHEYQEARLLNKIRSKFLNLQESASRSAVPDGTPGAIRE